MPVQWSESQDFWGELWNTNPFSFAYHSGMQMWRLDLLPQFTLMVKGCLGRALTPEKGKGWGDDKEMEPEPCSDHTRSMTFSQVSSLSLPQIQQIIFPFISRRKKKLLNSPSPDLQTKFTVVECLFLSKPQVSPMLWIPGLSLSPLTFKVTYTSPS